MPEDVQLVVFALREEEIETFFGVSIEEVQEIIRLVETTRLPEVPDFVEGIINLRGGIVPVIDLKKKFTMGESDHTENGRIIVFDLEGQMTGLIVDEVSEVLRVSADKIEKPPAAIGGIAARYIGGVAKVDKRLIIVLDLNKVLEESEQEALQGMNL